MADERFTRRVIQHHEQQFERHPTWATSMGLHGHDTRLEDPSLAAAAAEANALRNFLADLERFAPGELSPHLEADRRWLAAVTDGRLQTLEDFRPLETDPDHYSSGITEAAFSIINRDFAPADQRLRSLLARMDQMPGYLEAARENLGTPPRVRREIALDQLEGNREFFRETVPAAFATVGDPELQAALAAACKRVDEALARYEAYMRDTVLPRCVEPFAIGAEAYRRKLHADELIDTPLETLLALGEQDLARTQAAMREAAAAIDPAAPLSEVLDRLGATHVAPEELLATTQGLLGEIVVFLGQHDLITLPAGPPLHVIETPPFLRATTTAAMDTPGPFEERATDAYYYMTLPNPAWPADEQEAYMRQWTRPLIANLSVHEAYPGHYVQFLLAREYPSATRRILWSPSNAEGWAHYCEHMMVEVGYRADDPWYRIAQLQDALLRNARLVVGLRMHTAGMTLAEARAFFEREAYLAAPVAKSEAWRGATDPTYGYYTLGKLMLLQLREDVRAARGEAFSLKAFHDEFLRLGPIPIPLAREAMLGVRGEPLRVG